MSSCLNPTQCAARSVGAADQLFSKLIQTLIAVQCSVSPRGMWPEDYGPIATKQGTFFRS